MTLLFCALISTLLINGLIVFLFVRAIRDLSKLHYEEKAELFNRFMSGDYKTYKYFKDEHPVMVDDMRKTMEKEREKTETKEEAEKRRVAMGF